MQQEYSINGSHVGLVMREACLRAMNHALDYRFEVEARTKIDEDGRESALTDADVMADKIICDLLKEQFPDYGIVSEESGVTVCSVAGESIYFTVDSIDGTSAYTRKQPFGWGCMIALVHNGDIIAVCIGDANSAEMYSFRPGSDNTHRRLSRGRRTFNVPLHPNLDTPLFQQALLLRDIPENNQKGPARRLINTWNDHGKVLVTGGSIGLSMAQLWMGIVGACIVHSPKLTPWDETPVLGMCRRLGFQHFTLSGRINRVSAFTPKVNMEVVDGRHPTLIIHKKWVPTILAWTRDHGVDFTQLKDI